MLPAAGNRLNKLLRLRSSNILRQASPFTGSFNVSGVIPAGNGSQEAAPQAVNSF